MVRVDTGRGMEVATREQRGMNNPKERKVSKAGGAPVKEDDIVSREQEQ